MKPNQPQYELMSMRSIAQQLNDRVFTDYYTRLMLIARALFKWNNLPNGLDEKWIERYLFRDGSCIFYKDTVLGLMVAGTGYAGPLNAYSEPTLLQPIAPNYMYEGPELMNNENAVIIRNNDDMVPTAPTIQLYAMRLTDIDRTITTNVIAQKIPLIIKTSNRQLQTFKNVIRQRNDNEPVIYGDKSLDTTEAIQVLKTDAPIVFDKLEVQKHMVWNECMSFLGVNNANMDKRERVVTGEVEANDEQIRASEDVMLKARQKAAELINGIFGTNISVERRTLDVPIPEDINEDVDVKEEKGGEDE